MDITALFKACVKTVKTRNKALGVTTGVENDKNRILNTGHSKTKINAGVKAKDVVTNITRLRDFLLEHRKDYINTNHLISEASMMKEHDREKIDSEAQAIMKTCSQVIKDFKKEVAKFGGTAQQQDHYTGVGNLLERYLRAVCKVYSEQKAIRVKRAVTKQKLSRLEPLMKQPIPTAAPAPTPVEDNEKEVNHLDEDISENTSSSYMYDEEMSPEETQMFEEENQRLYEDLNSLVDEVRQIEGKVVEISRLQEVFAEKILEQEKDIDRVATTVIGTTENIKDGNEELRQAMKNNAGFRVWILFFLIVMSFSLLFLDWYNP